MFLTVKRLMALSFPTHREQLEQRTNLTWPRPFLLRPPFLLFLVYKRISIWFNQSTSRIRFRHPAQVYPISTEFGHEKTQNEHLNAMNSTRTHHFVLRGRCVRQRREQSDDTLISEVSVHTNSAIFGTERTITFLVLQENKTAMKKWTFFACLAPPDFSFYLLLIPL